MVKRRNDIPWGAGYADVPYYKLANIIIHASAKKVFSELGTTILNVTDNPESVQFLATMIAARAIGHAEERKVDLEVIIAILESSLKIAIKPTGEYAIRVYVPRPREYNKRTEHRRDIFSQDEILDEFDNNLNYYPGSDDKYVDEYRKPPLTDEKIESKKKEGIEVGDTTVMKDEHGVTHIHIHNLTVYISADMVQQMNVNPQLVQNVLAEKMDDIVGKIRK